MLRPQAFRDAIVIGTDMKGKERYLKVSGRPFFDGNGRLKGYRGTAADVTDQRSAEQERHDLEARFYEAQKLEAMGTLASGVAHDFNNILAIIMGHAELLGDDVPVEGHAAESLHEIIKAGRRAVTLIDQILAYSRKSEADFAAFDLARMTTEIAGMIRAVLPKSIAVNIDLPRGIETVVSGNATQLHQVLMNLCVNARDAMAGRDGTLTLRLEVIDIDGGCSDGLNRQRGATSGERIRRASSDPNGSHHLWIGVLEQGPHVRLTVIDTGTGMDMATLSRIFDPFFTTKEVGEGTGLGLAATEGIVVNHRGALKVESRPGVGTQFDVILPLAQSGVASEPLAMAAATEIFSGTALVVDDEPGVAAVMKQILQRHGLTVTVLTDPIEALRLIDERPKRFDLLLTDHTMPGLTGLALTRTVRNAYPGLPVILCSGRLDPEIADAGLKAGAVAVLGKPVAGPNLIGAVAAALAGKASGPAGSQADWGAHI